MAKRDVVDTQELAKREDMFRVYRDMGPTQSYAQLVIAFLDRHRGIAPRTVHQLGESAQYSCTLIARCTLWEALPGGAPHRSAVSCFSVGNRSQPR